MRLIRRAAPLRTMLALAVVLSLGACGGGGGGGDPAPEPSSGVTLQGVAAKGLLKNAVVKAYRVNTDGSRTLLKENVTNTTGTYELTGLPTGELILIEISAGASTTMIDEATNAEVSLPGGFVMRAATVLEAPTAGGTNTLQVTPFSEMAVAKAEGAPGGLNKSNVIGANADVRSYVGFDVLAEKPVFNTAGTTPENRAALLLASVSELANSNALGCSGSTGAKVQCVIDQMAELGTSDATLAAQIEQAKTDAVDNEGYVKPDVPAAPVVQAPDIVTPDARSGVEAAKALIANIRSNAAALNSADADSLQGRVQAVEAAFYGAANPLHGSQIDQLRVLVAGAEALDDVAYAKAQGQSLPPFHGEFQPLEDSESTCVFTRDAEFSEVAESYDEVTGIQCLVAHAQVWNPGAYALIGHSVRLTPATTGGGYLVQSSIIKLTDNDLEELVPSGTPAHLVITRRPNGSLDSFALQGKLASKVSASGDFETAASWVDVSLTPSVVNGATRLNLLGHFKQLDADGQDASSVHVKQGSYLQAKLDTPGELGSGFVDHTQSEFVFDLEATVAGGYQVAGKLTAGSTVPDGADRLQPQVASFAGAIKGAGGVQLFAGRVDATLGNLGNYDHNLPESNVNFLKKTVVLDGALLVPGRSDLEVKFTLNETAGFGVYGLSGYYRQDGAQVNVNASGQRNGDDSSVTFSTPSGISMTVAQGANRSDLTKGGLLLGYLDRAEGILYYVDNTRESF